MILKKKSKKSAILAYEQRLIALHIDEVFDYRVNECGRMLQKTRENFSCLCPRCCLDTEFRMRTLEEEVLWVKEWLGKAVHYGGIPAVAGQ